MPREAAAGVYLEDRRVGTLTFHDEFTRFDYEDFAPDHPVLGQAFEDDPRRARSARVEVPEWFANLLPEPESPLRQFMADQLGVKGVRSFPLLVHLGEDLPGAVRVVAEDGPVEVEEFDEKVADIEHVLRFSLAGVQLKFSMLRIGKGLTLPVSGRGGDWIVKLPDRRHDQVPENEHAMLTWAGLVGIQVPDHELVSGAQLSNLPEGVIRTEEHALAVRRFDRDGSHRIHMEDFAQVREVYPRGRYDGTSYDALGRVVRTLCPEDVDEYVRRLVALVVMGNSDAHLKNWTLRYPDGRTPRLAPAYDLVCVTCYPGYDDRLAFRLGGESRFHLVKRDHFRRLAERAGVDPDRVVEVVDETVAALQRAWPAVLAECPMPPGVAEHVRDRLVTLPLGSGR